MPAGRLKPPLQHMEICPDERPSRCCRGAVKGRGCGHQLRSGPAVLTSVRSAQSAMEGRIGRRSAHDIDCWCAHLTGLIVSSSPMTFLRNRWDRSSILISCREQEGLKFSVISRSIPLQQAASFIEKCARGGVKRVFMDSKHQSQSLAGQEAPEQDHRIPQDAAAWKHAAS